MKTPKGKVPKVKKRRWKGVLPPVKLLARLRKFYYFKCPTCGHWY